MSGELLWEPSGERISHANISKFITYINNKYSQEIANYQELWTWSVENNYDFWNAIFDFCDIIYREKGARVCNGEQEFWKHRYFPDAKLNFAENLLWKREGTALIFVGESREEREMSWEKGRENVEKVAVALKDQGVSI